MSARTSTPKALRQSHPKRFQIPLLLLVSGALLAYGLYAPVLTIQKKILFWEEGNTFSIISGCISLFREGHIFLSVIIFFFSVVFPVAKLIALLSIWALKFSERRRQSVLTWLEALGKWSMLDVFVVAIIVVTVKLGSLANAQPRGGIYAFAAAILLTMMATFQIDRLSRKT